MAVLAFLRNVTSHFEFLKKKDFESLRPLMLLSLCQSVIFGSLILSNTNHVILGGNLIFQKFELSLSCSTFAQKLKISEIDDQNDQFTIAGRYLNKTAGICYSQFPDINQARVEPSHPEIGEETIAKEEPIHPS